MVTLRLAACLACALAAAAQSPLMPLSDVRAGMRGTGRTVFAGARVEEFQVEILGILENTGPKQSIILARLSGGPLAQTGVMQGMSGSPVYIDGKLIGAVALSFAFSKEPIAGIRPIADMLAAPPAPAAQLRWGAESVDDPLAAVPRPVAVAAGGATLQEIASPLWLGGFTRAAAALYTPRLRAAGFEPAQGISGGRAQPSSAAARIEPGSMISVQLMTGDMNVGADGTVTYLDGAAVHAFGHRFLAAGPTELPFARSEVLTLLANQQVSFKISSPREWMGAILADTSTGIRGELGRRVTLAPLDIAVNEQDGARRQLTYRVAIVRDRVLAPLLVQMAAYSALDSTERVAGPAAVALRAAFDFEAAAPLRVENFFSADAGAPQLAAAAAAAPLAYAMQSGFDGLQPKAIRLELDTWSRRAQLQIDSVSISRRDPRPGDSVEIAVGLNGEGAQMRRSVRYAIPVGAHTGPLYVTVCDAATRNVAEYKQFLTAPPRSAAQLAAFLNGMRPNHRAYVRLWRAHSSFTVEGETLADPPPSLAIQLGRAQTPVQPAALVAEIEIPLAGFAVSGSRTVQMDIKE